MMDVANSEFILFLNCAKANQLRYMVIGGYAVNYYGYHRHTHDLDLWIAPTEAKKTAFINTLHCMGFTPGETEDIAEEDFTQHFKCSLGAPPDNIDVLTIIHDDINFDLAEKEMIITTLDDSTELNLVSYEFLKDAKTRSHRFKVWNDISKLDQMRKGMS